MSPTTITLLRNGISFLILFSMGSGWMFSPVDIMIHSGGEMESGEREEGRRKGENVGLYVWRGWIDKELTSVDDLAP